VYVPPHLDDTYIHRYRKITSIPAYAHSFGLSLGCHVFPRARKSEMIMTRVPKVAHMIEGSLDRLYHGDLWSMSFRWQTAGKINARAVAETPPVISSMTPRSQVMRATAREERRMAVVKKRCRCWLKDSCVKKYCSITSRHTNSSRGRVVNMFRPKQKRATLIRVSLAAKLFNILP